MVEVTSSNLVVPTNIHQPYSQTIETETANANVFINQGTIRNGFPGFYLE